jgi:hypothetical protein
LPQHFNAIRDSFSRNLRMHVISFCDLWAVLFVIVNAIQHHLVKCLGRESHPFT